jgi:zinc/manganese transport system substrate-binding protein
VLAGCETSTSERDEPLVLATTSIVGDLVGQVAGEEARVEILIPVGADPHDFEPSARQAASLREADLVVTSGLGLEVGLADAPGHSGGGTAAHSRPAPDRVARR